jgi:hypothetical protein
MRLLEWAEQGHEGVKVVLMCEDYPSLRDRQITKIANFPTWLGELKRSKADGLGFHLRDNKGVLLLRNLKDATRYQSAEFAAIGIDELTKNPLKSWDELRGSLRWPGINNTFFVGATNPNGKYFKWVRQLWIEKDFTDQLEHLSDIKNEFKYIRALPGDNPYLEADYWQMLNTLPKRLRKAWRDGDWYVAVEGLVFDSFTEDNLTSIDYNSEYPFEIAIDDGFIDPRATLFIQRTPRHILVFDELYQTKTLEEKTIEDVVEKTITSEEHDELEKLDEDDVDQLARKENFAHKYIGLPALAAVSHEAVALRTRLRKAGIPARNWMRTKAGGTGSTRRQAIQATRSLLCDGEDYRALLINHRCKNLIDEITSGYRNKEGADGKYLDVPEKQNDHACDALTSWVWLRARRYTPQAEEENE